MAFSIKFSKQTLNEYDECFWSTINYLQIQEAEKSYPNFWSYLPDIAMGMRDEKVIWLFNSKDLSGYCYFTQLDTTTIKIVCFEIFESQRSRGVGTFFYKLVEDVLRSKNISSVILEPTFDAESFWRKNGFKKVASFWIKNIS